MTKRNSCPVCRWKMREAALEARFYSKGPEWESRRQLYIVLAKSYRDTCANWEHPKGRPPDIGAPPPS